MKTLRIGVAGLGIGEHQIKAALALHDQDVVISALCDLDDEKLKKFGEQIVEATKAETGPLLTNNYGELLDSSDVVVIATPNYLHHPMAMAAINAGKHVLVEKPTARMVSEAEAMVAACEQAGVVGMVHLNNLQTKWFRAARQLYHEGAIGNLVSIEGHWVRLTGVPFRGLWFTDRTRAGGGALIDLGPHLLGLMHSVCGWDVELRYVSTSLTYPDSRSTRPIDGPYGGGKIGPGPMDVETRAFGHLVFNSGVWATMDIAWATSSTPYENFGLVMTGHEGSISFGRRWFTNNGKDEEAEDGLVLRCGRELAGVKINTTEILNPDGDPRFADPDMARGQTLPLMVQAIRGETIAPNIDVPWLNKGLVLQRTIDVMYASGREQAPISYR